ncbi:hypothetical protein M378DRAFT_596440 [Amanita muscaria Koide BX008]|uniref:Uncharacterized protein n=1 Tax=Amanita muscaria (strain Koide BX008) TaxID=946122 RepID=A0A0C2RYP0_AMAMK|nr:hypothetical protein M378DRAFT_596440 [Amanita muscaria Koide BX008]
MELQLQRAACYLRRTTNHFERLDPALGRLFFGEFNELYLQGLQQMPWIIVPYSHITPSSNGHARPNKRCGAV